MTWVARKGWRIDHESADRDTEGSLINYEPPRWYTSRMADAYKALILWSLWRREANPSLSAKQRKRPSPGTAFFFARSTGRIRTLDF